MFWRITGLLLGVFACSTSVIWIKASETHPLVLCAMRLLLAALLLAPLAWRDFRGDPARFNRTHLIRVVIPALVLAVHFISWTYGARMTLAAPASLIVNLVPIAVPFFLQVLVGETINRREIMGTLLALAGVIVLAWRDVRGDAGSLGGNLVCLGSMLLFAWYLALGRRNRDFPSLWLYVVPIYAIAGVVCAAVAGLHWREFAWSSGREWSLMAALAVLPTIVGHSLLNASMRHLRGQVVSLANVGQFIFAGVMAFFLFGERPQPVFVFASVLAVAGVAVVVFAAPPQPRMR